MKKSINYLRNYSQVVERAAIVAIVAAVIIIGMLLAIAAPNEPGYKNKPDIIRSLVNN